MGIWKFSSLDIINTQTRDHILAVYLTSESDNFLFSYSGFPFPWEPVLNKRCKQEMTKAGTGKVTT